MRMVSPGLTPALFDPDIYDDAFIAVVIAVEYQRLQGGVFVPGRGRDVFDHRFQYVLDVGALLGRNQGGVGGVDADDILDFVPDLLRPGGGQVDLVDDWDDLQPMLGRQIGIGEGLRLHPLGGVDDEDGPFAGREGAGDLVAKVHVPGGVDQVEGIGTAVRRVVVQGDGVGLDGDPPFPLEIHAVEELVLHIPQFDRPGLFEDTVGQVDLPWSIWAIMQKLRVRSRFPDTGQHLVLPPFGAGVESNAHNHAVSIV